MVQSILIYGAEAWGCFRCLEPLEQVQLGAFQSFFGVPRSHPRTSLLAEMEVLSVDWEARIRCIGFWHRILTDQRYHRRLIQRLAYAALMAPRSQWMRKLGICLVGRTVHTWVGTQRIQLGGEGYQAYGPWATHRDVGHQLQSYEGGSRSCQKGGLIVAVSAKHCSFLSLRRWLGPLP